METTTAGLSPTGLSGQAVTSIGHLSSVGQEAVGRGAAAAEQLSESGRKLAAAGDRLLGMTRECVRRNPLTTAGVAVGVLVGAGLLLSRRWRRTH